MGGGTRYMRYLLRQAIKREIKVKFVGVKLDDSIRNPTNYIFIPLVKSTDKWWRYLIISLFKVPFLGLEPDEIIHVHRLIYLLPYVLFYPSNPKVCTSDRPLVAASKRYPYPIYWLISKLFYIVERYIMKRIDAVIAQESVLREYYQTRHPDLKEKLRYEINPAAGVNTEMFRPLDNRMTLRKSLGILPEEKVILFVGRLAPVKRVDFLIDAFVEFKKSIPKSRFLIIGRGESETVLRKYADKYEGCRIEFLGEKRGMELVKLYNCADILVLASQTEGNPTVVREALACGVPVVSTNVGDVEELINDPHLGRIVSEKDPKSFAKAMYETILWNQEKVRAICREKSLKFSEEATFEPTYNLYWELTQNCSVK